SRRRQRRSEPFRGKKKELSGSRIGSLPTPPAQLPGGPDANGVGGPPGFPRRSDFGPNPAVPRNQAASEASTTGGPATPPPGLPVAVRPETEDPNTFWDKHFRSPTATKDDLLLNLAFLRSTNRFIDIQAAIRWFLMHHGQEAEPWMYEMLA